MTDETPKLHEEDIPDEFPAGDAGGEPELDDEPLGVQRDGESRVEEHLPGIPSGSEPPSDG